MSNNSKISIKSVYHVGIVKDVDSTIERYWHDLCVGPWRGGTLFYAVEDRIPRVYPWMNEPGGGIMPPWNTSEQRTVSTIFNTTWFGFVNTAAGS